MKNFTTAFKSNNLKMTPQRIAIYEMLKNTTAHPTAETIYNTIIEDFPTMSLATVYKSLKTLEKVGLIQELNVGEQNFRYDANPNPHPHIVCIKCGKVDDIMGVDISQINSMVKEYTDYKVLSSKTYFYGLCPDCKMKRDT